jgi:hypothetical protein
MKVGAEASFFIGKLLFGCVMFSLLKIMSQQCVKATVQVESYSDCPEGYVKFERPVFSSFLFVASMSLSLIFYYLFRQGKPGVSKPSRKMFLYILLPALLDATCVSILMAGTLYIAMSLTMTLKGVRIVYSTILVVIIFKRKQYSWNILGVIIAMIGVSLAALSAVLNAPELKSGCLIGVGLVLLSEFVKSLMVVVEEYLMKQQHCDPFFMIGLQGCWGTIILLTGLVIAWLVIPGKDLGSSLESLEGTMKMISESSTVIGIMASLPLIIAAHFMCSVMVTKLLSSVHNAMASVLMTALVWLIELFVHYVIDSHLGNKWGPYSVLQLVGFGLVTFALAIYDGTLVRLPWLLKYPPTESSLSEISGEEMLKDEDICRETCTSTETAAPPVHLNNQ